MTSAVEKKGDVVDLFIELKKKGLLGEPSHVDEYPETVLFTLQIFVQTFMLPNGAVPSKRSKSKFANWIVGLQELQEICPTNEQMKTCMEMALKKYENMGKSFIIYQPQSVKKLLIDAASEYNRDVASKREQAKELEQLRSENKFVDAKTLKNQLGNLFDEE